MSSERYPLRQVILDDLTSHNKVALFLLFGVIISAVATIWITHQTRLLTAEQGKLVSVKQKLESQYTHLQLEEKLEKPKITYRSGGREIWLATHQKRTRNYFS